MSQFHKTVTAAIFVKPLHLSKLRLSKILTRAQRRELTILMLLDVVRALRKAGINQLALVTGDRKLLSVARQLRLAHVLETKQEGVNKAAQQAMRYARQRDAEALILLPADIPFIKSFEIRDCLRIFLQHRVMVVCPSTRYDGTNMMVVEPRSDFEFHYEEGTFLAHLKSCLRSGEAVYVYYSPNIALDLDTEEDVLTARKRRTSTDTSRFLSRISAFDNHERGLPHGRPFVNEGFNPKG